MFKITIDYALNGYIVKVGCQTLVYETIDSLIGELKWYLENPEETERDYREHAINRRLLEQPVEATEGDPRRRVAELMGERDTLQFMVQQLMNKVGEANFRQGLASKPLDLGTGPDAPGTVNLTRQQLHTLTQPNHYDLGPQSDQAPGVNHSRPAIFPVPDQGDIGEGNPV